MAIDWNALVIGPTIAVFGENVTYYGQRSYFAITGVFDEAYTELTPLGRGGMASESLSLGYPGSITTEMPVLGVQIAQFPFSSQPEQGDTLVICRTGATYVVKEVRLDGHGGAKLLLNLQAGADP
jgi:hypothetical protein